MESRSMLRTPLYTVFLVLISHAVLFGVAEVGGASCPSAVTSKFSWFLNGDLYYMLYDDTSSLADARCYCDSLPSARLAVFDDNVAFDDNIKTFLIVYHWSSQFWLDAERPSGIGPYTWATNCSLFLNSTHWHDNNEPGDGEEEVRINLVNTIWMYWGISSSSGSYRALCQSATAPFNYLPTPMAVEWVRIGPLGHWFGFSTNIQSLSGAKAMCERQAGSVYLATLDTLYTEVGAYILSKYPTRAYWLDATIVTTGTSTMTMNWATGGPVSTSDLAVDGSGGPSRGLLFFNQNGAMKLIQVTSTAMYFFICEGSPATTSASADSYPTLNWVPFGTPPMQFGFSDNQMKLSEARKNCEAQSGRVRLAVLDVFFSEVTTWVRDNHDNREYWVDATRYKDTAEPFRWATGDMVVATWKGGGPDPNDWAAKLDKDGSDIKLESRSNYDENNYYICQRLPEIRIDWRLLGTPPKLFGFSRTQSWSFAWAKRACSDELGDVSLAVVDTHFTEVQSLIDRLYPSDTFWVDATVATAGAAPMWSTGQAVSSSSLHSPSATTTIGHNAAFTPGTGGGSSAIETQDGGLPGFYFICYGTPASPVPDTKFAPPCVPETKDPVTTTTTLAPVTTTECTAPIPVFNISAKQLEAIVEQIRDNLTVDTSNLSSTVRKATSAKDSRPSAQAAGGLGIAMLTIPAALIVLPDLLSLGQFAVRRVRRLHRRRMRRRARRERQASGGGGGDGGSGGGSGGGDGGGDGGEADGDVEETITV